MALSAKNSNGFFDGFSGVPHAAEPMTNLGWFAMFALGSEVEQDQRSRVVRRRTFVELGGWSGGVFPAPIAPKIEDRGIVEIYIDLSDIDEETVVLAQQIKTAVFKATGLSCSIGVKPNKLLSKIGSDLDKPDGLTILEMKMSQPGSGHCQPGRSMASGPRQRRNWLLLVSTPSVSWQRRRLRFL